MLRNQPGIFNVSVALLAERATVTYDPQVWDAKRIADEIEDIGFEASPLAQVSEDTITLNVYGMTCASCSATIERELASTPGVTSVSVSLATEKCKIAYDSQALGVRDLVERVEDLGFDAVVADDRDSTQLQSLGRVKEISEWRSAFLFSLSMAIPVFLVSMVLPKWSPTRSILMWQPIPNLYLQDLICLVLTVPVQFGIGMRFYRTSYKALKHGSATMDVLIVIGTTASFTFSALSVLIGLFCSSSSSPSSSASPSASNATTTQRAITIAARMGEAMLMGSSPAAGATTAHMCKKPATFFDTSTMLITFVSFGRYLENAAKGKTSEALSRLIGLTPSSATIYADGIQRSVERSVASELVQRGDYVKVVPGDKIVADGVIVSGESTVDESMITGEPVPIHKTVGSQVIGGTVNGTGTFDFLVQRAGKETSLAQIVKLVDEAQTSKAPIQAFADRVAGYFVPTVVGLGLITFVAWMVIAHLISGNGLPHVFNEKGASKLMVCLKLCISVIVVACPCALGLSTPTAVMVGTGVGAQNGILIKGGGPLEACVGIERIYFDKTGTLTKGKLRVIRRYWVGEVELGRGGDQGPDPGSLEDVAGIGLSKRLVLQLVSCAESRSEHPLARAVAAWGTKQLGSGDDADDETSLGGLDVTSFESITGKGIRCRVRLPDRLGGGTHLVNIGNREHMVSCGGGPAQDLGRRDVERFCSDQEGQGRTVVFGCVDGALTLVLSLEDSVKPEAKRTIEALKDMGIRCGMVTGDSRVTALAVARQVGIDERDVHSEMSPNGKRTLIANLASRSSSVDVADDDDDDNEGDRNSLLPLHNLSGGRSDGGTGSRTNPRSGSQGRKRGKRNENRIRWSLKRLLGVFGTKGRRGGGRGGTAMVGDGINDSPALAASDVGIALSSGADIAIEAASIVLTRSNLLDVPASLHLGRRIFLQIQLNFVWATIYNLVGIPLAMGIFLPWGWSLHPMMAGAAMAFSSVSVVLSSLTLRWWKRPAHLVRAEEEEEEEEEDQVPQMVEPSRSFQTWSLVETIRSLLEPRPTTQRQASSRPDTQQYRPISAVEMV
ncbi:heavy metal translocatin [Violaceomyces palustris]|uniref:Heavy metal translocatin n=1 Tax=Violaceomyces palustris TaxID=1673888 RepID=A0ACD0P6E2_9BASI|nr:heavy metal translocatin [Violaceomyces palustris]